MTKYIIQLFLLLFVSKGLSQSKVNFNAALDTICLREFSTEYKPILECIDSALQFFDSVKTDEMFLLSLDSSMNLNDILEEDFKCEYYLSLFKMKKINSYKYQNSKLGYFRYEKQVFFLILDYDINKCFKPTGIQNSFSFYDMKKLELTGLMKHNEIAELLEDLGQVQYGFVGDKFYYSYRMMPLKEE